MKKNVLLALCSSTLLGLALVVSGALAEDEAQPSPQNQPNSGAGAAIATTSSSGIVSEAGPDSIAVKTNASPKPVTYHSDEATTWVDESGNPIDRAAVKAGVPVTVYYSQSGSKLVAAKVVVKAGQGAAPQPRG